MIDARDARRAASAEVRVDLHRVKKMMMKILSQFSTRFSNKETIRGKEGGMT
jgi:hypothetical protein